MEINFDPGIIKSCLLLLGLLFIKAIVLFFLLLVFASSLHLLLIAVSLSTFSNLQSLLRFVTMWMDK